MVADAVANPLVIFLLLCEQSLSGHKKARSALPKLSGNLGTDAIKSAGRRTGMILRRQIVFQLPVPCGALVKGVQNRMLKKPYSPGEFVRFRLFQTRISPANSIPWRTTKRHMTPLCFSKIPLKVPPGKKKERRYLLQVDFDRCVMFHGAEPFGNRRAQATHIRFFMKGITRSGNLKGSATFAHDNDSTGKILTGVESIMPNSVHMAPTFCLSSAFIRALDLVCIT